MVQKYATVDKESLIETIDILSDSKTLREIQQGMGALKVSKSIKPR